MSDKSRATTINQLPTPQSRVEQYAAYLTGKSTNLADLPIPQSRVEEYLEFLCYNGGTAGGGLTQTQVQAMINELLLVISTGEDFLQLIGVNSQVLSNIPLMTDQQVQDIKNLFV